MKIKWRQKFVSIMLFFIFILTGCQNEAGPTMDKLTINFQEGDLPSLHPHKVLIYLRGISIAKTLYEGLTRLNPDGSLKLAGASSIDVSPDGLHYTIELRDNRWSDGTPVTAAQYEKAWKAALAPLSFCSRTELLYYLKNGEEAKKGLISLDEVGVRARGDKTLLIDLAHPCPNFLTMLSQTIFYPLRHPASLEATAFNGPFKVEKWEKGKLLRLMKNPFFWDQENISLKQIDALMMQDMEAVKIAYENRAIDWIGVPLSNLTLEQIINYEAAGALNSYPVDRVFWIFLNNEYPAFASPLIRKALSLALERSQITRHILVSGKPLLKPFPENLVSSSKKRLEESTSQAKELFEKGLKELGLTRETFPQITFSYAGQANRKQLAEYIAQTWSRTLGIKVKIQSEEWTVLRANLDKGLYQATGCYEGATCGDPIEVMERFTSIQPGNFSRWLHPLYTETVKAAKREANLEKRAHLLTKAEGILMEEMPFIPVCSDKLQFVHLEELRGYAFDSVGAVDFAYAQL
jgi:oligopeptide transport system substrate-binding protein